MSLAQARARHKEARGVLSSNASVVDAASKR